MLAEALREIEARRAQGFKSAHLSLSRYGNSRGEIKTLRDQLFKEGYRTRIEPGSGVIIVEWE